MTTAALLLAVGCHDDLSRTTGTVSALPPGQLCFAPEDPEQTDLRGCFPVTEQDAEPLRVGDCITLRIPYYGDPENAGEPVQSVRVLDRECRRP